MPAVLQVSTWDEEGARFNGLEIHRALRRRGARSAMAVMNASVADDGVFSVPTRLTRKVDERLNARFEDKAGIQRVFLTSGLPLLARREFWGADVVHLQLLHGLPWFSLLEVPVVARLKPTVWTWHDPWIFSGHCVYSLDCDRWRSGCDTCPDLALTLPVARDSSAVNWWIKRFVARHTKAVIVVASQWMRRLVEAAGMSGALDCRVIPFGVDTRVLRPRDPVECRKALGIDPEAHVIAFRDTGPQERFKNSGVVVEALRGYAPTRRTVVLCFQSSATTGELGDLYDVKDLGWVRSAEEAAAVYAAADVFLMPSKAEAFGLMAVEAMSCGTPVIVADGTSLPEVVHAPHVGVSVPEGDAAALGAALGALLEDPDARRRRGAAGRRLVEEAYTFERYLDAHVRLYEELARG
jgi:glycosyltransferase involved in cell wall biosynthesis